MNDELGNSMTLVLAAGRGTRMGGPKALMTFQGHPWWRYQSDRLVSVGVRQLWVVSPEVDRVMSEHPDACCNRVVADPMQPMFESLIVGIRSLEEHPPSMIFVLPVDVPVPDRSTHIALADAGGVAIPIHRGRTGHPVMLSWPWIQDQLLPIIGDGRDRAAIRLDQMTSTFAQRVEVADASVVINLNTPCDMARWCNGKK